MAWTRRPSSVPSGLPAYVTDDIEPRDNPLILAAISDENRWGRLEELHDLIDVFIRPDRGKWRLEQSPDGKVHHLGSLHRSLKERALAQRPDQILLIEHGKLRDAESVHGGDRIAYGGGRLDGQKLGKLSPLRFENVSYPSAFAEELVLPPPFIGVHLRKINFSRVRK